jgi:iron complex transport system substrate-binding protein
MRIVSLVPHATELLFALGLGDEVVAVTHECDYPPAAAARRRITCDALASEPGDGSGDTAPSPNGSAGAAPPLPNRSSAAAIDAAVRKRTLAGEAIYELDGEALAALRPDLIVTQALCPVCAVSYEEVAALAGELPSRPRVLALDPQTLGESLGDVRTVAEATDRRELGVRLVREAATRIDRVRLAVRARRRVPVVALEWLDPVYVAGHWTPQLIELAGGEDVLGFTGEPSQVVSWEDVVAAGPELLVVMPCGYDARRAHAEALAHAGELAAVRAPRIVAVNASAYFSRPGPRLIDGLELLAHILHPDRVPEAPAGAEALAVELTGTGA